MISVQQEKLLSKVLGFGAPLVTIFIINGSVTDPVNTPKFFLLGIVGFGALGTLFSKGLKGRESGFLVPYTAIVLFLVASIITLVSSQAPISQSLYGVYGRNTGFLTYLFLCLILISSMQLSSRASFHRILNGFMIAGFVNIVYCGWVLIFGDFLAWSNPYGNILGTLGNPNFIGAFLGIFFTVVLAIVLSPKTNKILRISGLIALPVTAVETYLSHAIQGRVLIAGGTGFVGFLWLRSRTEKKLILGGYSIISLILGALALAGALQKGPLTAYIYKTSVSLRGQYWLAGWNTGESHPFSGVGYDAFGDWYRRMRDVRAITLPGVNTVVNTAHNVFLDMFAFGGWPLFLVYCFLNLYTISLMIRGIKQNKAYDPVFVALASGWICYFIQSLISINQIGLAIWGWLFSGLLIAYNSVHQSSRTNEPEAVSKAMKPSRKTKPNQVLSPGLTSGVAMVIGALIAVPPLNADMKWLSAQKTRSASDLELSLAPSYLNPQNSFKYLNSIRVFEESGLTQLSHKYALEAIRFNSDSYDLWRALYIIQASSAAEREEAVANMKRLDPLNPDVTAP